MKTVLIYGASRGLGQALAEGLSEKETRLFVVSRSRPAYLDRGVGDVVWIEADLSKPEESTRVVFDRIGETAIDLFIYNVGIWEQTAFSEEYDFSSSPHVESRKLIETNVLSLILHTQGAIPLLRASSSGTMIFIGSTWGEDHNNGREVAFSASKGAMRGLTNAVREIVRGDGISVTLMNLGYMASEHGLSVSRDEVLRETDASLIPVHDVVQLVTTIDSLSAASCPKIITMPATADVNM